MPRERPLKVIKDALRRAAHIQKDDTDIPNVIAIVGPPGSGKTQLVCASCADEDIQDYFFDGIYWLQLDSSPDITTLAAQMLNELTQSLSPYNHETVVAKLQDELTVRKMRMLIVLDNVWNSAHLAPFLQGGANCVRLITTQDRGILPLEHFSIWVDQMEEDEAATLLQWGLPPQKASTDTTDQDFRHLANELGKWPLLLALVNGTARERIRAGAAIGDTLQKIKNRLEQYGVTEFQDRERALSSTLELALNRLTPEEKVRCNELVVFNDCIDAVPLSAVQQFWKHTGKYDEWKSDGLCAKLYRLSLLSELDLGKRTIKLHPFIAMCLIDIYKGGARNLHEDLIHAYKSAYVTWREASSDPYVERLSEHGIAARNWDFLKELLLDYEWIVIKYHDGKGMQDLLKLYQYDDLTTSESIQAVRRALEISVDVLTRQPEQLPAQFVERLRGCESPGIPELVMAAQQDRRYSWLCPHTRSLAAPEGPLKKILPAHVGAVRSIAVSASGDLAVSGGDDGNVCFWDLHWGTKIAEEGAHNGLVTAVAITPDGSLAITGASDEKLRVWQPKTGKAE